MLQPLLRPAAVAAHDRLRLASPIALPSPPVLDFDFVGRPGLRCPGMPPISFSRASVAMRVNASGLVEAVAADAPRFDHHPMTGARLGLLMEGPATNAIAQSQNSSGWTPSGGAYTDAAAMAPDGMQSAVKVTEDGTNGTHRALLPFTSGAAGAWTVSGYFKAAGRRYVRFRSHDSVNEHGAFFDLVAGVAGAVDGGVTAVIQPVGNGWFRCAVTWAFAAFGGSSVSAYLSTDGSTISYQGDGAGGVYLWGMQAEQGGFATSYIRTAGAPANRAQDFASIDQLAPWFNPAEGTLLVNFDLLAVGSGLGGTAPVSFNDGTANELIHIRHLASAAVGMRLVDDSTQRFNTAFTGGTVTANTEVKAAFAFKAGDHAGTRTGSAAVTNTYAGVPTVTMLSFGPALSEAILNGHIRRVVYWPKRLSNALLQLLTL